MKAFSKTTLTLFLSLALGVTALVETAQAQNRTTLLVLSEAEDGDSLAPDNRVTRRVRDAVQEQMNAAGFDVYDEQAVTFGTIDLNDRRLGNGELVDIARNNAMFPGSNRRIPVSAVATYQIYVNIQELSYTNVARIRVTGRLIDAQSGRFMGTYELVDPAGEIRLHPTRCSDRDCVLERVGDHARDIGQAVGNQLAVMLAEDQGGQTTGGGFITDSGPITYSLRFENMNGSQMTDYEEYIVEVFSGYRDHTPINSTGMVHEYDYVSTIDMGKLRRNLQRVLHELGWQGTVIQNGNLFTIRRTALRGSAVGNVRSTEEW